jgi:mono/diheme cytochrome c family protein
MKSKFIVGGCLLAAGLFNVAFKASQQQEPWPVPEKDAKAVNPVKSDAASIAAGKALWETHCSSCHGKKGLGDGSKAAQLKTQPSDFSKASFQSQSDGSIFYKMVEGRKDMPSFKKKIPDAEDNWSLVVFVRTLKK